MTSRFSSELFDHPQGAGPLEGAEAELFAELVPTAVRDALADRDFVDEPVELASAIDLPDVFVPDHYEPNYAYPLLVWLENAPLSQNKLDRRMRQISDRNYFGVALEAGEADTIEERLHTTFLSLRRRYHLNTERVYLLGSGDLGTLALTIGLCRPAWFGGIAAFSAAWPDAPRLLSQFDGLRGKRALLAVGEEDDAVQLADVAYGSRLLWTAGMNVTTVTASADGQSALLREIDRWVMQGIEQPELVC